MGLEAGRWQKLATIAANNSNCSKTEGLAVGKRRTRRGKFGFCVLDDFFDMSNSLG